MALSKVNFPRNGKSSAHMDNAAHCLAGISHVARELTAYNRKVRSRRSRWKVAVAGKTLPSNGPGPDLGPHTYMPTGISVQTRTVAGFVVHMGPIGCANTHVTHTVRMNSMLRILGGQRLQSESVESSAAGKYPRTCLVSMWSWSCTVCCANT